MKLGVVIAVSKYADPGIPDLPGCAQDAKLVQTILTAQDGYQEILILTKDTNSADVKRNLIDFIKKYKENAISEFVFYYTGHGVFLNNEYYYLFSDYQEAKLRQTALENTELDNLIRSLKPSLTTKMVDSCQSGLPYIKDRGELGQYLKGTQSRFQNCYFLFSSQMDQSSYQGNVLSAFTRSVGELVASRTGVVRHKDIIDYVSDSFALSAVQTPFFVVQADFTDHFCKVDATLQKKILELLASATDPFPASTVSPANGTNLKALVEADAQYYCTKDETFTILSQLSSYLADYQHPAEVCDLYNVQVNELPNYSDIPNLVTIGKWFKDKKHDFFAEPIEAITKVKRVKINALLKGWGALSPSLTPDDYEFVYEPRITGVQSTTEMPYAGLLVRATTLYPNLDSTGCFLVPFVSRTNVLLFAGMISFSARGWEQETITREVKWRAFDERMKDKDAVSKMISTLMKNFWDFTLTPVKRKYGLLKEEPESDTGNNLGKKNSSEQKNPHANK